MQLLLLDHSQPGCFLVACGPSGKVKAFMDLNNSISCPRCGDKVPVSARFCGNCGLSMQAILQARQSSQPLSPAPFYRPPSPSNPLASPPYPPGGTPYAQPVGNASAPSARKTGGVRQKLAQMIEQITQRKSAPPSQTPYRTPQIPSGPLLQPGPTSQPLQPEPPGLLPERAIILAMNRSPAESRIDLPLLQVRQSAPQQPALAETPGLPSGAPQRATSAPMLIPRPQPDGKGAPLPRNLKQFRRRVIGVSLAAVVILAGTGFLVDRLLTPAKDPTLVDPTQLGSFPASSALAASSLPFQTNAAQANEVSTTALPSTASQAATLVKAPPSTFASRVLTLNGLGQTSMGVETPVDLSVAANNQYVVEAVDGGFQIADNQGKGLRLGFAQFFSHIRHAGDVFGEPRVIFDPTSQEWVLVVDEVTTNLGNINASYFDVGISTTKSPLGLWHVYQIPTQSNEFGNCNWADAPQVGSNRDGFFISGSIFTCGTGGELLGVVLWELPKSAFAKGKSVPPLRWVGFTNSLHQPLLSLVPAIEAGSTSTEWLIGNDAGDVDDGNVSQTISLWAIMPTSAPGAATTLPSTTVQLGEPYADPPQAQQPKPDPQAEQASPRLSTGDARVTSAQFINGQLYAAFTTAVNWTDDTATRSGIYWLDLAPSVSSPTGTASAQVVQSGILGRPNTYLFTPVLAADAEGNVVLSAQISSADIEPGIIYSSRRSNDPPSQMGENNTVVLLQAGTAPFGAHWGDYMGSSLVIYDQSHVWPKIWITAPVIDVGDQSGNLATSWHTSLWEFGTGGSTLENIP